MHITVDVIKRDLLAWHEFREEDTKNMKCKNGTLKDPVLRTYSYFFFLQISYIQNSYCHRNVS